VNCFQAGARGMVLVLTLLGTAFAEQPGINGMPGGLTWQNVVLVQ
jgi:hypothetical protein